jgi:hypothetical protein
MTGLVGIIIDDTIIVFAGKAADASDILIIAILNNDLVHLIAQTSPPIDSADFFIFNMDATARSQRKYGGGNGEPNDPYLIYTAEQMNAIGAEPNDWDKNFQLMADIDLSVYAGTIFNIIGNSYDNPFMGVFDGMGHTVSNFIFKCFEDRGVGLFGYIGRTGHIKNLELVDAHVTGHTYVGALVGYNAGGYIQNCRVTSNVQGVGYTGGIAGISIDDGLICDCQADVWVSGQWYETGGIAGANSRSIITRCAARGIVAGKQSAGGITGRQDWGIVSESSSTCSVTGTLWTGGLVGRNAYSSVSGCFAAGDVSGVNVVGGLVGFSDSEISDCWAGANVSGESSVGGLLGENVYGFVFHSYSRSVISGGVEEGGFVGGQPGRCFYDACFWDSDIDVLPPAIPDAVGIYAKPSAEMKTASTFLDAGWDFVGEAENGTEDIWWILEGQDYPRLTWELDENKIDEISN